MQIGSHEIKAAIFDVDGTILDSMSYWMTAADKYLDQIGVPHSPGVGLKFISMNMEEGAEYFKQNFANHLTMNQILDGIINVMTDVYSKIVNPKNGVLKFMNQLRQNNIPIMIATATDRKMLQAGLDRLEITELIDGIITCTDMQTSKRVPDIYLECAKRMGCTPQETVVFEDALYAIETAKNAGFIVVGIEDDSSKSDKNEIINKSTYYIQDFSKIGDFLCK